MLELNGAPIGELPSGGRGRAFNIELQPGPNELRYIAASSDDRRKHRITDIRVDDASIEVLPPAEWMTRESRVSIPSYQGQLPATANSSIRVKRPD